MKRKMRVNYIFLIFVSSVMFLIGCNKEMPQNKEIIVSLGCNDTEIISDIEHSLKEISPFLKSNNVNLMIKGNVPECGYLLKFGSKQKNIDSAITDVELIDIGKDFFEIN